MRAVIYSRNLAPPPLGYDLDAAQYLNSAERAAAEGGEGVGGTLSFLTRGMYSSSSKFLNLEQCRHPTIGHLIHG